MERKYISEFGIFANGDWVGILQQSDFKSLKVPPEHDPHIYFITRHPRTSLDPSSLKFEKETLSGTFVVQKTGGAERIGFSTHLSAGEDAIISCVYPHNIIEVKGSKKWFKMRATNMMPFVESGRSLLDLEVLYIGQAYGNEGERTIEERITSHSTLQAIYSETVNQNPDQEIWIVIYSFSTELAISLDGTQEKYSTTSAEDDAHIQNVTHTPISEQQVVNFVEAALIRYFQPEYNKTFKNTFPNPAHSTYAQCYDLDINSIIVSLDTTILGAQLYSRGVKAEMNHLFDYQLHSKEERKSMLEP